MKSLYRSQVVLAAMVGMVALIAPQARAQYVTVLNSPDHTPSGSGLANMNLETLLHNAGIYSNIGTGVNTDQVLERAFQVVTSDGVFSPRIDVLFSTPVRVAAAGYHDYHRIGWYQRQAGQSAPAESAIKDVVWEQGAAAIGNVNSTAKLTTTTTDFDGLSLANSFELRLTSATSGNDRGGSIFSNDALNSAGFQNISYFKERDINGNLVANSYIVAWEDLRGGGDKDYQDVVIRVKYVKAVNAQAIPEAGTLSLLVPGLGLLGGMLLKRRRSNS